VTSLICGGLADAGMDYDDLIFSLLADRLNFLLEHRRAAVAHIVDMLESDGGMIPESQPLAPIAAKLPAGRRQEPLGDFANFVNELSANLNVLALGTVLEKSRRSGDENESGDEQQLPGQGGRLAHGK